MSKKVRIGAAVTAVAIFGTGCAAARAAAPANGPAPTATGPTAAISRGIAANEPLADVRPYANGDTGFGLDLLHAWCAQDPRQNVVFSPSTLASSLGMAYLGAHGATAAAMARVLHLPATTGNEAGLRARTRALASLDGPNVQVSGSNEVWDAQPSLPSYLNALATAYQAGAGHLPADPGQAATEINDAIAKATGGQITNLLSPDQLRGIGWVLTSAMYLKAKWATPFEAAMTEQLPFTTASRTRIEAPFMTADGVRTGSADGWTSVVLPYQGGKLSLVAMLPPAAGSSCAVPSAGATAALASGAITGSVALPKVDLRTKEEASGLLKALGMGIAFGQGADFTGISANACCIGFVQQAATLRLDEKGTVASAAAATGVVPTSMRQPSGPQVVFNRPYLLLITTSGGEPLFLARVANPAGS